MQSPHIPVLLQEVLDSFGTLDTGTFIDMTLGYGGHSEAILKANPKIKLIGVDRDDEALEFSKNRLEPYKERVRFIKSNFGSAMDKINADDITGILADIGVSSLQLDKVERGFSFGGETLDMRMDTSSDFSAYDVINYYSEGELERIIRVYGEERMSKKIASMIVKKRKERKIESSKELSELIASNIKGWKIHPATLTFQAIRIEVNSELTELEKLLECVKKAKKTGLILGIISFHSLEDRIVKTAFKEWSRGCICPPEAFRCECGGKNEIGEIITKKPITASQSEIKHNPRARSAKLRVFRFY